MFNPKYADIDKVRAIYNKALDNLAQGVVLTEWASEGSAFKAVVPYNTKEVLLACERYFDEYEGNLITEVTLNFLSAR